MKQKPLDSRGSGLILSGALLGHRWNLYIRNLIYWSSLPFTRSASSTSPSLNTITVFLTLVNKEIIIAYRTYLDDVDPNHIHLLGEALSSRIDKASVQCQGVLVFKQRFGEELGDGCSPASAALAELPRPTFPTSSQSPISLLTALPCQPWVDTWNSGRSYIFLSYYPPLPFNSPKSLLPASDLYPRCNWEDALSRISVIQTHSKASRCQSQQSAPLIFSLLEVHDLDMWSSHPLNGIKVVELAGLAPGWSTLYSQILIK